MIFIKGNAPSLKNSKVKGIYHPKTVTKYLRSLNIQSYSASRKEVKGYKDPNKPNLFIQQIGDYFNNIKYPAVIGLHFIRDSHRKFDFNNCEHILADLLSAHHLIEDDNMDFVTFVPFRINSKDYSIDKENPGTWLKIFKGEWDLFDIRMVK